MILHDRLGGYYNYLKSIPIQCLGAAIFFWVYHKSLIYWMQGINLGALKFDRHVAPLYAETANQPGHVDSTGVNCTRRVFADLPKNTTLAVYAALSVFFNFNPEFSCHRHQRCDD